MSCGSVAAARGFDAFSWQQFRILLFAIRKGEKRVDSSGMGSSFGTGSRFGSRLGRLVRRVFIVLAFLVMASWFWFGGAAAGSLGASAGEMFTVSVLSLVLVTILMGLYQAVNTLYFVRDLSYYLTLPLSATSVMWAKLTHFLVGAVAGDLMFLPLGLGCLFSHDAPVGSYGAMALAFVLCAVAINLALTIGCVLLMRFSRLAYNRDRFSRAFGAVVMVFALAIGVGSQLLVRADGPAATQALGVVQGLSTNVAGLVLMGVLCPPWLASGLVLGRGAAEVLGGLALMVALTAVYALALNACARRWYFEGVRSLQGAGGKSARELNDAELRGVLGVRGPVVANLARDWATMVRTPVFFNQCVLGLVLMPLYFVVIIVVAVIAGGGENGLDVGLLLRMAPEFTSQLTFGSELLLSCALGMLLLSVFTGLSAYPFTMAVSRDGEDFFFLRAFPLDWRAYLVAKLASPFALAVGPMLVLLVVAAVLLRVPPLAALFLMTEYLLATLSVSMLLLGFGARFPRLHWDNEAQLFKGGQASLLVFAGMLVALAVLVLPGALMALPFITGGDVAPAMGLFGGLALQLLECVGFAWWLFGPTSRSLARREP